MGTVDAASGNLHLEIALGSSPQRGGNAALVPKVIYDSHIWTVPTDGSSKVWTTQGNLYGLAFGTWGFHEGGSAGLFYMAASGQGCNVDYMLWSDAGVQHFFNIPGTWNGSQCSGGTTYAADASGYQFRQTAWGSGTVATVSVYAPDGTEVYGSDLYNAGVASKDSNGNYLGLTTANSVPPGVYNPVLDTLGRKVVNQSTVGNVTTLQVMKSQGGTSNYVITTATIPVKTHFQQSGITECTTNCTATVIRSIGLPDGSSYSFLYDCDSTTGNTACNSPGGQSGYYGTLTKMTLPTGGTVTYGYTTFKDALGAMSRWLTSKYNSAGGYWSYSPTVVNSSTQQVTVSKPDSSKEVITFTADPAGNAWPTQTVTYQTDGATVLSTVYNTWYFDVACTLNICGGKGHQNVRNFRTTTTLPLPNSGNITKTTTYAYDSPPTGNITAVKEWKYQSGTSPSFSSVPDRATNIIYHASTEFDSPNIINRPFVVSICNNVGSGNQYNCPGGGTPVAVRSLTYDNYGCSGCGTLPLQVVSGVVNHDDANFGGSHVRRGNLTNNYYFVDSTSNFIGSNISYDTTGQVVQASDTRGNLTSYFRTDSFFDDNGADPPATHSTTVPTNAYLTKVTDAIGSTTTGYYFGSGKLALAADYNARTAYTHYLDPLDRPTKVDYPVGWSLKTYGSPTQYDSYSAIGDTAASSNCTSCIHAQTVLDGLGRMSTQNLVNNPAGAVSVSTSYDGLDRVSASSHPYIGTSDPNYVFESSSYDGLGRSTTLTHPDGQVARQSYGANVGNSGGVTNQQGSATAYGYGFPVLSNDEAGHLRQEWIDGFGHVIEVDEPSTGPAIYFGSVTIGGNEQSYTWYPCGTSSCPTTVYDSGYVSITVNGFTASAGYNQGSSSVSMASALASVLNSSSNSPVTASTSTGPGCFPGWACVVNLRTKSSVSTAYALSTAASSYDTSHFPTPSFSGTAQAPYLQPTITNPYVTLYSYDVLGNLTQVVQGSQTRTYQYDGLGRLTKEITPEAGTVTLSYVTSPNVLCSGNPSNPCSRTDARGITTTYAYDAANRLKQTTHSDSTGTVAYAYDTGSYGKGRLASVTEPSGSETYTYDQAGRIITVAKVIAGTTYTTSYAYNAGGELTKLTYPSGRVVQYSYDNVGHVCAVAASTTNCSTYTNPFLTVPSLQYDAAGRPLTATYGNGVVARAAYSPQTLELSSLSYAKGTTTLFGLNYLYQYDSTNCPTGNLVANNGQIQCITDTVQPGRSTKYTYDSLGRLSTANTFGSGGYPAWGLSETYDRYGNRTTQTVTAGSGYNVSLSINASDNQITGYTYDFSGNITAYPSSAATFVYDGEECNTSYVGNGNSATYTCDANHQRVKKVVTGTNAVTTVYVRSGGDVLAEYDNGATASSPTREYIYGNNLLATVTSSTGGSGGTITYQHRDHLSPRLFTDVNGNDVGEEGVYPFGEAWYSNSAAKNWVFTSYERDPESGNDYALAREYADTQGRFLSPDPLQGIVGDPQSWNRYAYVENDPINLSDPSGQGFWSDLIGFFEDLFSAFGGGGSGGVGATDGGGGDVCVKCLTIGEVVAGSIVIDIHLGQPGVPHTDTAVLVGTGGGTECAPGDVCNAPSSQGGDNSTGEPGSQGPGGGGTGAADPSPGQGTGKTSSGSGNPAPASPGAASPAPGGGGNAPVLYPSGAGKPYLVNLAGWWGKDWLVGHMGKGGTCCSQTSADKKTTVFLREQINGKGPWHEAGHEAGSFHDLISPEARSITQRFFLANGQQIRVVLGYDQNGKLILTSDVHIVVHGGTKGVKPTYSPF